MEEEEHHLTTEVNAKELGLTNGQQMDNGFSETLSGMCVLYYDMLYEI